MHLLRLLNHCRGVRNLLLQAGDNTRVGRAVGGIVWYYLFVRIMIFFSAITPSFKLGNASAFATAG